MKKIKVLVVDDSALVRQVLSAGLGDQQIEVVGTARDAYQAAKKIKLLQPDVMTLDVDLPRMNGLEFLRQLMPQHPMPVIMVSAITTAGATITLEALGAGAVDFIEKPASDLTHNLTNMLSELKEKIKLAAKAHVVVNKSQPTTDRPLRQCQPSSVRKMIAIGASTGGVQAIRCLLGMLPPVVPGIVIVQHMPPPFTSRFAASLRDCTGLDVVEAQSGDTIVSGRVLVAPGGTHMMVQRVGTAYQVECLPGHPVNGHCPSIDVLFHSVARNVVGNAIGVLLTGMGNDGASGLLSMRQVGARTLVQDEATSVVYGMPKVAYQYGAADLVLPLDQMAGAIMAALGK